MEKNIKIHFKNKTSYHLHNSIIYSNFIFSSLVTRTRQVCFTAALEYQKRYSHHYFYVCMYSFFFIWFTHNSTKFAVLLTLKFSL